MTQQTILNIQMVPAGLELCIAALRKLPHEQVDPLVQELWAQYKAQVPPAAPASQADVDTSSEGGTAD